MAITVTERKLVRLTRPSLILRAFRYSSIPPTPRTAVHTKSWSEDRKIETLAYRQRVWNSCWRLRTANSLFTAADALAMGDVEAARDDYRRSCDRPAVRDGSKNEDAEAGNPDKLRIGEWG